MSLRAGDRVADYQVIGMLGVGGMGAVYQVKHLISERVEALKILLPDLEATPDVAERFMREIRLQASLNHPNIASLHNALRIDNQLLMVMEFIDGHTLAELMRQRAISLTQAVALGAQVLGALEYAHSKGVVHRDVKPSNVMIDRSGIVKLMDFGIARAAHEVRHLTQTGAAIGSVFYMSPEQIHGEEVDGRSDVYGTGVLLFEVMTGELPLKGSMSSDVMQAHLNEMPPWPGSLNPAISAGLSRVLLKALEKDRINRYQSADEFRHELLRAAGTPQSGFHQGGTMHPGNTALPTIALTTPPKWVVETPGSQRGSSPPMEPSSRPGSSAAQQPPSSGSLRSGSQPLLFDPLELERVRKELAQHVGPMAKVLVDRAARQAQSWQELYSKLAPEIPAGKMRERFLASRPR